MFNMKHYLLNFNQVCLNYGTGAKWPRPGVTLFTLANYRENIKTIFLSETTRLRSLVFFLSVHLRPYVSGIVIN